ncbi:SRSF protein kinase 2 [Dermatophagoides pteronyssinus]|uniref:non-specific serine/threonine protein kinase n=1 Tax=Dermatophagoides pteronyssinus TaxID=6956 RepID=A0ABQ8JJ36_DERPT|nr:SRSF protein kinase 2 [Dermatophagoides pteronyssinus]
MTKTIFAFILINSIIYTLFLLKSLFFRQNSVMDHNVNNNNDVDNNNQNNNKKAMMAESSTMYRIEKSLVNKFSQILRIITWSNYNAHNNNEYGDDDVVDNNKEMIINELNSTIFIDDNDSINMNINNNNDNKNKNNNNNSNQMKMLNILQPICQSNENFGKIFQVKYEQLNQDHDSNPKLNNENENSTKSIMTTKLCGKIIDLKSIRKKIEYTNGISTTLLSCLLHREREMKRSLIMADYYRHYQYFRSVCQKLLKNSFINNNSNNNNNNSNKHLVYYEQIIAYNGHTFNMGEPNHRYRVYEKINDNDCCYLLPYQIIFIMPMAVMNLKEAIYKNHPKGLTISLVRDYSKQIIDGLQFLHGQFKIAHLNLKPENILLYIDDSNKSTNEIKYCIKLVDILDNYIFPVKKSVQTLSPFDIPNQSIQYAISPLFIDYFYQENDQLRIQFKHDLYCLTIIILIMLIGYEQFEKRFIVSQLPYRIQANPLHQNFTLLIDRIKLSFNDQKIATIFSDWFEYHLAIISNINNNVNSMDIMKSMIKHQALQNKASFFF